MRVLVVTGTRAGLFGERLEALKRETATADLVITGGYGKTDLQAAWLARKRGCHVIEIVPCWDAYHRSAGPRRNTVIAETARLYQDAGHSVRYAAFPGEGEGTRDYCAKLKAQDILGSVYSL